jgi:hypothetical protein
MSQQREVKIIILFYYLITSTCLFNYLEYARLMHPREEKVYTDGDLNHSMGNVFARKTHQNNLKASRDQ